VKQTKNYAKLFTRRYIDQSSGGRLNGGRRDCVNYNIGEKYVGNNYQTQYLTCCCLESSRISYQFRQCRLKWYEF